VIPESVRLSSWPAGHGEVVDTNGGVLFVEGPHRKGEGEFARRAFRRRAEPEGSADPGGIGTLGGARRESLETGAQERMPLAVRAERAAIHIESQVEKRGAPAVPGDKQRARGRFLARRKRALQDT